MRQCQRVQLRLLHRISCVLLPQARVDTGTHYLSGCRGVTGLVPRPLCMKFDPLFTGGIKLQVPRAQTQCKFFQVVPVQNFVPAHSRLPPIGPAIKPHFDRSGIPKCHLHRSGQQHVNSTGVAPARQLDRSGQQRVISTRGAKRRSGETSVVCPASHSSQANRSTASSHVHQHKI
jgi:hypothetical protein